MDIVRAFELRSSCPESSWSPPHGPRGPTGTAQAGADPPPADVVAFVSLLWEPVKPSEPRGGSGGEGLSWCSEGPQSRGNREHVTTRGGEDWDRKAFENPGRPPTGSRSPHRESPGAALRLATFLLTCRSPVPASLCVSARLFLLPVASLPSFLMTVQLPLAT